MYERIPDLFLVGAPRCGTTAMYTYLKQHPEIYLSVLKEPHFFSTDLTTTPRAITDERQYRRLFSASRGEKRVGEGSVWYLSSARAPAAIRAFSPDARILVMLRNPIDMIHSLYALYRRTGNEDLPTLDDALDAEEARARGERMPAECYFPEGLLYTSAARYTEKLRRYMDTFGRERVHVVIFDDFIREPAWVYGEVLTFLEVDPSFEPALDLAAARRLIRIRVLRQLRELDPEIRTMMREIDRDHAGPRPAMSPEACLRLAQVCSPDVTALSTLLGRDLLAAWCHSASIAARIGLPGRIESGASALDNHQHVRMDDERGEPVAVATDGPRRSREARSAGTS